MAHTNTPPDPTPEQVLAPRLAAALDRIYEEVETRNVPLVVRPILKALQPRLRASLVADPIRAACILTWLTGQIRELIGDVIDLDDPERVAAISRRVEEVEQGHSPSEPTSEPSSPDTQAQAKPSSPSAGSDSGAPASPSTTSTA